MKIQMKCDISSGSALFAKYVHELLVNRLFKPAQEKSG